MDAKEIELQFNRLAITNGLEFRKGADGVFTILGGGYAVWILLRVEGEFGVFVTLGKEPPSNSKLPFGFGVDYLVRHKTGSQDFVSDSRDVVTAVLLTEEYCLTYLKGQAADFTEFEDFATRQIDQMSKPFPDFNANRWLRPEWT